MTNEQIIFNERISLMNKGVLKSTGRVIEIVDGDGTHTKMEEPEELHTYQGWKSLGYQVQKGQKAISKFSIWKRTVKKAKEEDEEDQVNMFMVTSSFFSQSQVEAIKA